MAVKPGAQFLHRLKIGSVILLILLVGVLLVLAAKWPFTREATSKSLEQVSFSDIRIADFRMIFLPHPGYVAQQVTFARGRGGTRPIARISKVTCRSTWITLISFTHRIQRMDLEGLQIYIPAQVPPAIHKHAEAKIKTTVTELAANGTVLEIAPRHPGGQTVRFKFPELVTGNLAKNKAITFRADIRNPNPPGEMRLSGTVGPFTLEKVSQMPISGSFRLVHADLSAYKVIAGDLSAEGRFDGKLGHALVAGRAEIPNFAVTKSHHSLELTAEYRATVDGTTGDVTVASTQAHFFNTTLIGRGTISGKGGKAVLLDFEAREARIEDLLRLFVAADRSPLEGPIALHVQVVLPPTHAPFIRRVQLDGSFSINKAEFTNSMTQEKLNEFSARARGEKKEIKTNNGPERVAEDLTGAVKLRGGIATLSGALFDVPGAVARGGGTYDLTTEAIDLRGELAMHASLSKAATGVKSVLAIPLDPFFKKNAAGAVLPVHMAGTYSHPLLRISLHR